MRVSILLLSLHGAFISGRSSHRCHNHCPCAVVQKGDRPKSRHSIGIHVPDKPIHTVFASSGGRPTLAPVALRSILFHGNNSLNISQNSCQTSLWSLYYRKLIEAGSG